MSTRGILAIFNNVAPGRDDDFNNWFQGEHFAERLGVPGFLYGRRHQALSGSSAYFNFYVTESPDVLTSKAYLDRVDNPTPRSRVTRWCSKSAEPSWQARDLEPQPVGELPDLVVHGIRQCA